jgi:acetyltransferase-like isoleucine patch superfamily enzyme
MKFKRLWQSIRLSLARGSSRRTQYLKRRRILGKVGENTTVMFRRIPLYPELIRLHNNVHLASGVHLITHDVSHIMLNYAFGIQLTEKIGCIEILDNVYIGANVTIMPGIRIGPNAIVGAGSIVTKDIPPNTVAVGIPAKAICTLDEYRIKRTNTTDYPSNIRPRRQVCSPALVEWMWKQFDNQRDVKL